MKLQVKPEHVWGNLNTRDSFKRLDLKEDNKHINAIAKYNAGMFIVLVTPNKLNTLKLTYCIHYPVKEGIFDQINPNIRKAGISTVVKIDGIWRGIDSQKLFHKSVGCKSNLADTVITIEHNITPYQNIEEIQLCLPALGYLKFLEIEADNSFMVKNPTELHTIFLGSSIGAFNFTTASNTLVPYLYRNFGINTCSAAIPKAHTFDCPKLMNTLITDYAQVKKIVVDLENLKDTTKYNLSNYLDKFEFCIFRPSVIHKYVDQLIAKYQIKNIFEATADMCWDWGHPNMYGMVSYADWLIKNKKLIKGGTKYEKSCNN